MINVNKSWKFIFLGQLSYSESLIFFFIHLALRKLNWANIYGNLLYVAFVG